MMKRFTRIIMITSIGLLISMQSFAHCEIPCGIYDDELRISLLKEHFTTIEKSMQKIEELQKAESIDYNQLVRWVNNKEEHANKVQEIVYQYFLNQRIKMVDQENEKFNKYQKELTLLHHVLVYAMKAKQTTDQAFIQKLRSSLEHFEASYFEGKHRHNSDGSH